MICMEILEADSGNRGFGELGKPDRAHPLGVPFFPESPIPRMLFENSQQE
jgi:hypothetical protein